MVRTKLDSGCSHTPMRDRPLHPARGQFTPEASQTQAPVTFATEPERRAGGSLTNPDDAGVTISRAAEQPHLRPRDGHEHRRMAARAGALLLPA